MMVVGVSVAAPQVSQRMTGMLTAIRKNNVMTASVKLSYAPRLNSAHTENTSQTVNPIIAR